MELWLHIHCGILLEWWKSCVDIDWGRIHKFFENLGIIEAIKLLLSEFIENTRPSGGGDLDTIIMVPYLEHENLVYPKKKRTWSVTYLLVIGGSNV